MTSKRILLDDLNDAIQALNGMFVGTDYDDVLEIMARGQSVGDMRTMLLRWAKETRSKTAVLRLGTDDLDGHASTAFRRDIDKLIYELRTIYSRFRVYVPKDAPFFSAPEWLRFDDLCSAVLEDLKDRDIVALILSADIDI